MSICVAEPKIERLKVDASRYSYPASVLLSIAPKLTSYCRMALPISSSAVLSVPK